MKKYMIPVLALSFFLAGRTMAQTSAALTDTVAHAAQGPGVVGAGALPPPQRAPQTKTSSFFNAYFDGDEDRASRRVTIRWQMENEFNTDRFVLERSTALNPTHFDPLHEVVAKSGNATGQVYDDRDIAPAGMVVYYRLKVVLKSGDAFFSPAVAVNLSDRISLALSPSVLTKGGTLHFNENTDRRSPVTVNFFDEGGRLVGTYLVNNSYFNISTSGWSRGIYIYRISDGFHPLIETGKIMLM